MYCLMYLQEQYDAPLICHTHLKTPVSLHPSLNPCMFLPDKTDIMSFLQLLLELHLFSLAMSLYQKSPAYETHFFSYPESSSYLPDS